MERLFKGVASTLTPPFGKLHLGPEYLHQALKDDQLTVVTHRTKGSHGGCLVAQENAPCYELWSSFEICHLLAVRPDQGYKVAALSASHELKSKHDFVVAEYTGSSQEDIANRYEFEEFRAHLQKTQHSLLVFYTTYTGLSLDMDDHRLPRDPIVTRTSMESMMRDLMREKFDLWYAKSESKQRMSGNQSSSGQPQDGSSSTQRDARYVCHRRQPGITPLQYDKKIVSTTKARRVLGNNIWEVEKTEEVYCLKANCRRTCYRSRSRSRDRTDHTTQDHAPKAGKQESGRVLAVWDPTPSVMQLNWEYQRVQRMPQSVAVFISLIRFYVARAQPRNVMNLSQRKWTEAETKFRKFLLGYFRGFPYKQRTLIQQKLKCTDATGSQKKVFLRMLRLQLKREKKFHRLEKL